MRQAESPEDVETDHRPAEGSQVVVDLGHEPTIAATAIGRAGLIGAAPLPPTAIQHDLDRGVSRKRALGIIEEPLPIARDDEAANAIARCLVCGGCGPGCFLLSSNARGEGQIGCHAAPLLETST